jgi:hypothetical protein
MNSRLYSHTDQQIIMKAVPTLTNHIEYLECVDPVQDDLIRVMRVPSGNNLLC